MGRDEHLWKINLSAYEFQSTRPHGARLTVILSPATSLVFQSTRPHGARHQTLIARIFPDKFQSTRPHGARPRAINRGSVMGTSFNPRARMGRDTGQASTYHRDTEVSIHAPAWGATLRSIIFIERERSFNPRARMGRDAVICRSICSQSCFNPRARMGRDPLSWPTAKGPREFQSTRPHGARRRNKVRAWLDFLVSIHAPAWGATLISSSIAPASSSFQSTRPHGARQCCCKVLQRKAKRQSVARKGSLRHPIPIFSCQRATNNNCNFNSLTVIAKPPGKTRELGVRAYHYTTRGPS